MASVCIELATLDPAAAQDGSRPLEQVADASGIAWGGAIYQMSAAEDGYKVLLVGGAGLTSAQQKWPPLRQECHARLMMKREQIRLSGPMRSACWTDHANVAHEAPYPGR